LQFSLTCTILSVLSCVTCADVLLVLGEAATMISKMILYKRNLKYYIQGICASLITTCFKVL